MREVLIVDDLADAREMLAQAVRLAFPEAGLRFAESHATGIEAVGRGRYDLALVDLDLGDGSGIAVIEALAADQPECATAVVTVLGDDDHLFGALRAGAQGYLLKDRPADWLAGQLRGFVDGQPPLSPAIARRLLRHFRAAAGEYRDEVRLSPRETEVLTLLARGDRLQDIATHLGLSRHTVGDHVKHIYRKLNISSRAEAALRARGLGLA